MNLAAINFRSPITWVVIIGGGVILYFVFRHFQNQNATNAANTAQTVPAVGTSLFLETPPDATASTPVVAPTDANTMTYAQAQLEAQSENSPLGTELQDLVNRGVTITNVPAGVTLPTATKTVTATTPTPAKTADVDRDAKKHRGGGIPDTSNMVHISTWPYGGQRVRTRLG